MPPSFLIWRRIDHSRVREQLQALGEVVCKEILGNELLSSYRDHRKFQTKFDDVLGAVADDCVRRAYEIYCDNSNETASPDFKETVWEYGIDLFINGSPHQKVEDGVAARPSRFRSPGQTTGIRQTIYREIPDLLRLALNCGPLDSSGDASEKKGRMRRTREWLSSKWKYELAPTPEMIEAVALLARAQMRHLVQQEAAASAFPKSQDQANAIQNLAAEPQAPNTARVVPDNTEACQASTPPDHVVMNDQSSGGPSLSEAEGKDSGGASQEPSAHRQEPSANHTPVSIPVSDIPGQSQAITDRTYFIIEAEALVHSQDRPRELVAAYSTKGPYLRDIAFLCFADSSTDLLEKLKKIQADHQTLLIHWGESEEELEQLPDVLRAYLSLKETGKTVHGKHIDDALQNLRSFFESDRKKRGRPRQDALSERVQELRESGYSWGEIQILLNKETGVERTTNAYRNLLRSRRKPDRA